MRKLFIVLISTVLSSQIFPQSYRVNFFQTTPAYINSSVNDFGKSILNTFKNNSDEIYFCGNYTANNFSYITKYNSTGEKIFTYDFSEQLFSTSGFVTQNSLGQLLVIGQKNASSTLCLRVICFDANMNKLWDIITPANPESVSFYISDMKFDTDNNIYLTGDYKVSSAYVHSFTLKYSSSGAFLWQKNINTSAFPETPQNKIFQINTNSIYTAIRIPSTGGGTRSSFSFYELDKLNGSIIRNKPYQESFSEVNTCFIKTINNFIYLGCRDYLGSSRAYCLRKINSNWDTVWTKKVIGTQGTFELDRNNNAYVTTTPTPFEQGVTISFDINGIQRWIKNNIYGTFISADSGSISLYGPNGNLPVITKYDFNGNILLQSETFNPYLNLKYLFKNSTDQSEYKIIGTPWDQTSPINPYFNALNSKGLITSSLAENYYNDYAEDLKFFSSYLYLAGMTRINENTSTAFITKHTSNGSVLWNKNVFNNSKGKASIKNIAVNSTTIYGTGELYDTVAARTNAALVSFNTNGNPEISFSFRNILNGESSGKIIKINNSSVFSAGQYRDSLNRIKIFVARNIGSENLWLNRINSLGTTSDSLVNLTVDQSNNCYLSYNSYLSGISKEFTIVKLNSSGGIVFSKTVTNENGIFLKKAETDFFANTFTVSSSKINGNYDLMTQKFDSSGNFLWTDIYNNGSNTDDNAVDLVLDPANNIVIASNFVNSNQRVDAFIMKISYLGERVWNKTYNSPNKFIAKKLIADDLYCYYVTGFLTDASGNENILTLEYDKDGALRYSFNYNQRDQQNLLSFSNSYIGTIVTNVQGGQKFMYSTSNINRITEGSDIKINVFNSTITAADNDREMPDKFNLEQNYPNPFNPSTIINYRLSAAGFVALKIYDANGRLVKELVNGKQSAGSYSVNFSGEGLPSGVYYYSLIANGVVKDTKKAILMK